MANTKALTKTRDILIAVTAVLMIVVVVVQVAEIQKFELMDVIKTRLGALFGSDESAAPAPAAAAPAGDNAHGTSAIKTAVDAKRSAEADAGL